MELEISNNREIKPQKIAVKQFDARTNILTFTIDRYTKNGQDLSTFTAYAITCIKGEIDMTELTKSVSGSKLILTWSLSAYTLQREGVIAYQISFKGDKDSPAVFNTYQAIIQNSASIDESELVGDYPTIMKQWLDLINARSGAIPYKVVYMQPNASIPVEERTAGTLYYQWEEPAFASAVAATGIVNLGSSPYADSGLYIRNRHVYVDDTSDTVYVLDPSVWVETINNANVGVIASDVSSGGEIKILLTAASAGASGNNIFYSLGLAQYGAGKGLNNPSGGTTVGARLLGGCDAQTGVEKPIGQFEDHFGNVLARTGAKLVPDANLDDLLEDGEYICSGSFSSPITCTYCMLRVTDSPSTNRIIQECYVVDLSDHTVRTFVRSISGGSTFGAWRELVTDKQLAENMEMRVGFPDYMNGVSKSNDTTYTAAENGWLSFGATTQELVDANTLTVDGILVFSSTRSGGGSEYQSHMYPIAKGSTYKGHRLDNIKWYPCKNLS